MKSRIVITGGCGKIGSHFAKFAADQYLIRIVDRVAWDEKTHDPLAVESMIADLQDMDACRKACAGMDMVIHLAADADPDADFHGSLLGNNIVATHNMFRAAKDAACKRFIYASSGHVASAYPPDVQIHNGMTVRPANIYGATKCFGEALGAYFAYTEGLPTIALRIGAYTLPEDRKDFNLAEINAFLDRDDFNDLLTRCLETPNITFAIVHAVSNNRYNRLDLSETRERFGYQPKADAFEIFNVFPKVE